MNIEKLINDWRNSVDDYAKAKAIKYKQEAYPK